MANKTILRLISALILLCVVFSAFSCGNGSAPQETSSATADTTQNIEESTTAPSTTEIELPEKKPISFKLTADYKLVRHESTNKTEIAALQLLSRGIKSAYGFECEMITDITRKGAEVKPNEFEILVGRTNRNESKEAFNDLPYYDYKYEVVSENVIVICGGSPEATLKAVKAFLLDVLGYSEDESTGDVLTKGTEATLTGVIKFTKTDYTVSSLKIGTRDFSEYSLVVTDDSLEGITSVIGGFSRLCGINMPIVPIEEYKSGPAIFFGCANADGSHYPISTYSASRYYITESGENIFIDFKSAKIAELAAARFISEYLPTEATGALTVNLKGADATITGLNITSGTNGLVLTESSTEKLANGVYYTEHVYTDKNGAPVRAYAVTLKSGYGSVVTSLPSSGIGNVTSVKNMLSLERSSGKKAIASINADFFDMGGTNVMRGLCIQNGKEIHSVGEHPWFGITNDGKAVMGVASEYNSYAGKLQQAVGGSHIVLKKDAANNIGVGTEFADTRHPRTAVGVTPNGDVVFLIVDGRQTGSNGASLADLAFILGAFGCSDGINLDGGGSSTLVLSDTEGNLTVKNSPSAGSLRAVANGLTIVLP